MDTNIRELERETASGDPEAEAKLLRARERIDGFDPMSIVIDGETFEVDDVRDMSPGLAEVMDGRLEFVIADEAETAGHAARERWAEMAEHDPAEFRCMVGDEALVNWALGQYAGPGSTQVKSLDEWLDLHIDAPEEEFARYDGNERSVERVGSELFEQLGFMPTVAYRSN
jgi:hypothetical protein